jgi:hypothetical protein
MPRRTSTGRLLPRAACPLVRHERDVQRSRRRSAGDRLPGSAGATLTLQEGAFCETSDGCVPAGTDTGDAAFGDRQGTLVTLDDGGYAIVVGRADTPSWLAVANGMDEATFRQLAQGLVRLD